MPSAELAIRARNLGKSFWMGTRGERRTVPQMLRRWVTGNSPQRLHWALQNLNFDIQRGEILGVMGPNGAGKSTLLLLLARILAPSEGTLQVFGKTNPFFQLSAGLEHRLTVLDNFSLCSALLGMSRKHFQKKLSEMIAFSGLEEYLYAHYGELSAGFAARLPLATAIHADLDIILVDEMLAVGDHAFQSKCMEVFRGFKKQGKTLVIASHSRDLIQSLSTHALYLDKGRPVYLGDATDMPPAP